jgi:hypothetical protein
VNIIQKVTEGCDREDCRIVAGQETSTNERWQPEYNKKGRLMTRDPSTRTRICQCLSCGREWTVKTRLDEITAQLRPGLWGKP